MLHRGTSERSSPANQWAAYGSGWIQPLSPANASMLIWQLNLDSAAALQRLRGLADIDGTLGRPTERKLALTLEHIERQLRLPFETLGASIDDDLVGSASLCRMSDNPFDPDASDWFGLSSVIVHPDFRGQGLGKALVLECISRATRHGAKGILLEVNVPNPAAMALYDSLGFEAWNICKDAYQHDGRQFDQVSMRKLLRMLCITG